MRRGLRIGATAVAAVLVAEAAVWLLRPRGEIVGPVPVSEATHFSEAQLERARAFAGGQRALLVAGLAIQAGALAWLALRPPRRARRVLERAGRRPLRGAALVGAGLSAALAVAALPPAIVAHERSVDVGLSTQGIGPWLLDQGKVAAIGTGFAAAGAAILVALIRRFPRHWWVAATGVVIAFEVVFVWLAPVLLAPLFNRFERLPDGRTRGEVLKLAERAGVEVGEVYRVDASRRSRALNAYVDGIGPTKRVVIYDNLLERADREEVRSVVAHELGHVEGRDLPRGMLWVAISTPLALLFVKGAGEALAARGGFRPGTPASLPSLALVLALTAFGLGIVGNQLSRAVEARADTFALELTGDPKGLIDLQRRLALENVSDPDPPEAFSFVFGTHPRTIERIGAAERWRREHR